ncbi:MAG: ATP-dependent DNA helicase RecG [Planctomycetota bacterium]|nr:ATP-dependent DNA helicase RecG [Planctomycetota bacterium]
MTAETPLDILAPVDALPGVGPRTAGVLRRLGLGVVGDLLAHVPHRYEHEHAEATIAEVEAEVPGEDDAANVAVRGEIAALRSIPGRRPRIEATLEDATGSIRLTWFNAAWLMRKLRPGMEIVVEGRAKRWKGYLQIGNPKWHTPEIESEARGDRLRPIYPASEDLPSGRIEELVGTALDLLVPGGGIIDPLPEDLRRSRALPSLEEALEWVHRPPDRAATAAGRRRLAYDELLLLQLGVMMKRRHLRSTLRSFPLELDDRIDRRIRERLPFELTPDQDRVCREIARDLGGSRPMNRLLQGDVGSGKTAVAAHAMLLAVAHGRQAALMAPTGILAEQHHASISRLLEGAPVEVGLLTGSTPAAERRVILDRLRDGSLPLLVGTHALFSEGTDFHHLGLAIIDEQHRFGVEQRSRLRRVDENGNVPHVLVMTATPIPRTLSLTIFGDLDVSTILEKPPGRAPTVTRVVAPEKADDVYAYLAERVRAGEQGFVVVPAVEESDAGLSDVEGHRRVLAAGPLAGCRIGVVHGRLSAAEREAVMTEFRNRELDVLVATVVIEVGVDVPNATMIVIEHAERFGLAQLHQLRGRVGRGGKRGVCALVGEPTTEDGRRRLDAIGSTDDGFRIAELDLEIRGPGELFGARQSGLAPFKVADLTQDLDLLRIAREDASRWIEDDPALLQPRATAIRRRLMSTYGDSLGLGDVG